MTIFEYLYGDVYYTDEYGNAYFDSCVDIDYELDEIPEIVNLGDHTYFMAKEDLDLYNQYDIKVDRVSEDDLRFLHYTRRPYYQMRGRSVSREQAFDIIRRTDNFFNWDMETIGNRKEFVRCINFDNWLIMKNHYPKGYGWIHADGTVGANAITQKWPTLKEFVEEWFYKLKAFPYLDLVIGITNWDEISWDEDDTFEKAIQMGIYVHDKCIELLNKQNAWAKYQEYDEKYGADPERFETDYYQKNGTSLACSPETAKAIDDEVIATVKAQYEKAMGILRDHAAKLNELAGYLLEKETITGEEFMEILNR